MKISEKFIKASDSLCDFDNPVNAPYFRKEFVLDFVPEKAEITICGLGFYKLYINGEEITKGFLAPYISNPDDLCYYDNYDITKKLRKGKNVVGFVLGNGFRNSFGGFVWKFEQAACRGPLVSALCLEAEGEGQIVCIEADESFKTHSSPIVFDDLRMGCYYDARLELENWVDADFDDSGWSFAKMAEKPKGEARVCAAAPIKPREEIKPIDIKHFEVLPFAYESTLDDAKPRSETEREDVYVYDFGVNTAGVIRLKINGKKGQKITIRHGENFENGRFSINTTIFNNPETRERYLEYAQKDIYICKGGEEVFIPEFTYHGFRYAFVEGLEPGQATEDALTFIVFNSDIMPRAEFFCSDITLNKLFKMTRNSDFSNFHYFPTDCPHREKNGWTGDVSVSAEQLLLNLDCKEDMKEWLYNIKKAQRDDGSIPAIVPTGGWGSNSGPAWDSVCVNLPYYIFKYDGENVIAQNKDMILKYFEYVLTKRDSRGIVAFGLGDWIDPFHDFLNGEYASPLEFTSSAMVFDMAKKAAVLFDAAGLEKERKFAEEISENMRDAIRRNLVDFKTMTVAGCCQTSQAVAIEMGIFDDEEIEAARERLVEIVKNDGKINTCGMIGLRYMFHALASAGHCDLAIEMITSKERTCYGAWVERGATALLENFPHSNGKGLCSQNHHFFGDISSFMVQKIAGIKINPRLCNCNEFEISPEFVKRLSFAKGEYTTKTGVLQVEWKRNENEIELMINVPKEITCLLVLGNETKILSHGQFKFTQTETSKR